MVVNPCNGITCFNGGICTSGQCICASGWTGNFCEQQSTTLGMRITSVTINAIPALNAWDGSTGPDVYINLSGNGIDKTSSTLWDIESFNLPLLFISIFPTTLSQPSATYSLTIYDEDAITDDGMLGLSITPTSLDSGWPATIVYDQDGWDIVIAVEWIF